jgi:hypothetical protein
MAFGILDIGYPEKPIRRFSFSVGNGSVQMSGLRILIVAINITLHCFNEFLDTPKDFTTQVVLGEVAKEALAPRGAGRCEVKVKVRMPRQPALDPRCLWLRTSLMPVAAAIERVLQCVALAVF